MYLKGVGVTRDTKKANELFFLDSDHDAISYETFIGLEYLGVGLENMPTNDKKHRREKSIQIIQSIFGNFVFTQTIIYPKRMRTKHPLIKYRKL